MKLRSTGLIAPCVLCLTASSAWAQRFERIYSLGPGEGVFAYARISPDGKTLAYASEVKKGFWRGWTQTVTVVDLRSRRILFTEAGRDAYWSNDGRRMIFLSFADGRRVSIRNHETGEVARGVAPVNLGDYFSWAVRDRKNLILTIASNYYYLDGDRAVWPARRVKRCRGIGRGERPLISHDGRRITTFVRGTVVVRDLIGCDFILDTGIRGAKADFSWDDRYVAFHAPKASGGSYEIQVVDLQERTVRTVTNFPGSSFFPSWTRDGRLCFRYDGDDYRGFMFATDVLRAPARPLSTKLHHVPAKRTWSDVFPETRLPTRGLNLVMVWGTWSAHSPNALIDLERAREYFDRQSLDVGVMTATDPGSQPRDIDRLLERYRIRLPRIHLAAERLPLTEAHNQIPATLLFRDGVLIGRRLGAQSFEELRDWIVPGASSFSTTTGRSTTGASRLRRSRPMRSTQSASGARSAEGGGVRFP